MKKHNLNAFFREYAKLAFKEIQEFYADRRLNSKVFVHLEKIRPIYKLSQKCI